MPEIRRQATLFLNGVPAIEDIRRTYNPIQSALISAHVTLCREDEVNDWDRLAAQLETWRPTITLEFDRPERNANLVFLPGNDALGAFKTLRQHLLESKKIRDHKPHITLIHPRNGECTDAIWESIKTKIEPFTYTFRHVSFILQQDGGEWQTLQDFPLND